jgi:hypothetical protein
MNESGLGTWFLYDSLNQAEYYLQKIRPALKRLNIDNNNMTVMACDMFEQYNTEDCGLFALAYAIAICEDKDPSMLVFQQISMRDHFNSVLQRSEITQFKHYEIKPTTPTIYKEYNVNLSDVRINF